MNLGLFTFQTINQPGTLRTVDAVTALSFPAAATTVAEILDREVLWDMYPDGTLDARFNELCGTDPAGGEIRIRYRGPVPQTTT
ncbi:hypothetical protein [Tsukamurella hominis]|uniref:hypothetical protein n=1 Tax=Tsukamurella hominis TaxID=1970232 RepID=UPI0039E8494C